LEVVSDGIGENTYIYTDLTFEPVELGEFTCHLYPSGLLSSLGEFLGLQDVQLGDRDFDERFIAKASDAVRASRVLKEPFRAGLQDLATWADAVRDQSVLGARYVEFRIERARMKIRLVGYLESFEKLSAYAEYGKRLFDILCENGG
jgi:hypothetical protein